MKRKTVYYAHFMGIYNTPQEERDIKTLETLDLLVYNPNMPHVQKECSEAFPKSPYTDEEYVKIFHNIFEPKVAACDIFAFKAMPDGRIPGGVFMELKVAQRLKKIIIELPSGTHARGMGKDDTREYLKDIGVR